MGKSILRAKQTERAIKLTMWSEDCTKSLERIVTEDDVVGFIGELESTLSEETQHDRKGDWAMEIERLKDRNTQLHELVNKQVENINALECEAKMAKTEITELEQELEKAPQAAYEVKTVTPDDDDAPVNRVCKTCGIECRCDCEDVDGEAGCCDLCGNEDIVFPVALFSNPEVLVEAINARGNSTQTESAKE